GRPSVRVPARCCFSVLPPPPPAPTPFPYTTLFRSQGPYHHQGHRKGPQVSVGGQGRAGPAAGGRRGGCGPGRQGPGPHAGGRRRDRKSTRLNSSHVKISYAVFCLKKKNSGDEAARD